MVAVNPTQRPNLKDLLNNNKWLNEGVVDEKSFIAQMEQRKNMFLERLTR